MAERVSIRTLGTDKPGQFVIAMIISYKEPRKLKGIGEPRGVWNVTLRDSAEDTINMTVWGSFDGLNEYVKDFKLGDIVEIHDPRVQVRLMDDKYCPEVTSPLTLILSDADTRNALLRWVAPPDEIEAWRPLLAIPTKPPQSYTKLSDVLQMGAPASPDDEKLVNLLVAVDSVGEIKTGQNRTSGSFLYRRVTVYDQTGPTKSLFITLWNSQAERADGWLPKETVLFISDVKVEWRANRIGISLHQKSIITENPSIPDAEWLREYAAQNTPANNFEILEDFVAKISDTSAIRNVMTINTLLNKCEVSEGRENGIQSEQIFTAVLYVGVTGFDIDDPKERTLKPVCSICKTRLSSYDAQCYNNECVDRQDRYTELTFDLRVNLADHTGELRTCLLTGAAAERVFNCTANQFDGATPEQLSAIKWRYLLERVVARVAVVPPTTPKGKVLVSILSLVLAYPPDVAQHIPMQ